MAKRKSAPATDPQNLPATEYTVLARRYRPQQFSDVIGQGPVATALVNALESNRVAHAYLFTGARGVGKTSMARILAKALNCQNGPTATPCDRCDMCQAIATGDDVDVLEIDGASNRGIDEVREIRQNVQYRPARGRYKIYIIDEVHMLTTQAFNALLKTLEEPPTHVKFIFATTEAQKIPVTILSRCQRFDFAGIGTQPIIDHLRAVVKAEQLEADDDALELIARRAKGSMRDAQSLLDQLLAFGGADHEKRLTADHVHRLLGTANDERVVALASALVECDPGKALELLGQAGDAPQLGELIDQIIDYWRDLMVVNCAGLEGRELSVPSRHRETLARQAAALSLETILAGLDILSATKARLRGSNHARVLVEMALVRLGRLSDLVSLTELVRQLGNGSERRAPPNSGASPRATGPAVAQARPAARETTLGPEKKNIEPLTISPPATANSAGLTPEVIPTLWPQILTQVGPIFAVNLEKAGLPAILGPKTLVLRFPNRYNQEQEFCQDPARLGRIEGALMKLTGSVLSVRIESVSDDAAAVATKAAETDKTPSRYHRQRSEVLQEPLVKRASELLGAQIVQMDDGFGAAPVGAGEAALDAEPESS